MPRADWADGGQTDITDETLACGPDNRRVKPGGWRTRKRKDGRTEMDPTPTIQLRGVASHYQDRSATPTRKSAPGIPRIRGHRLS